MGAESVRVFWNDHSRAGVTSVSLTRSPGRRFVVLVPLGPEVPRARLHMLHMFLCIARRYCTGSHSVLADAVRVKYR